MNPCTRVTREQFPRESYMLDSLRLDGNWYPDIFNGLSCTGAGKATGKSDISTGTIWMGMGNHGFHAKYFDGNGKSRLRRELFGWYHENDICTGTGIHPNYREVLREFSRNNFSEDCPGNLHRACGLKTPQYSHSSSNEDVYNIFKYASRKYNSGRTRK